MSKKLIILLLVLASLLLFSSCAKIGSGIVGGITVSEDKKADVRMEQIISAIKDKDKEAMKSLFSKKALEKDDDFDNKLDKLFKFFQDDIKTYARDGWSSDESIDGGKRSLMIRFAINVNTDKEVYRLFVIDYNMDTINTDNEGVYMLEVRLADSPNTGSWQDRMRAGIYIH